MLNWRDKIILSPLWLVSLLPLRVLFAFSSVIAIILHYFIRYRRKVILENLKNSFPQKSPDELLRITKSFYLQLCDTFFETIYLLNMSAAEMNRRYKPVNPELIAEIFNNKRDAIAVASHYANWEWAASAAIQMPFKTIGVYKPLSNKRFDRLMIHIRGIYGSNIVPMKNTLRAISDARRNKELFILYLIGDQRPMKSEIHYWAKFMNQDTPVITGPEKLAKKYDTAILFVDIHKPKRGYYEISYKLLSNKPELLQEYEITDQYLRLIEEQIQRNPALYLWSHKRWKHKKEDFIKN